LKILITGASGFIGRNLVARLKGDGLTNITTLSRNNPADMAGVNFIAADIVSEKDLEKVKGDFDLLIHLAAMISFSPDMKDTLVKYNAEGTFNILKTAHKLGIKKAVVASSACTVGLSDSADKILDESAPYDAFLASRNPYMASKIECEKTALSFADKLNVVIVNPTTVYGTGDRTLNSGSLIAKVAKSKIIPLPTGGSNVVDVEDAARGIILAANKGKSGERYILGGHNLSFRQIFSTIAETVSAHPAMIPLPKLAKHPMALAAFFAGKITGSRFITPQIIGDLFSYKFYSSEKAERELGWKAEKSFSQSVADAWKFYKENGLL
jgi:dihydroflavonol-4-reductase